MTSRCAALLLAVARGGWRALRLWCGDAAYDVYAERVADGSTRISREAFYVEMVGRRYERPDRCC